MKKWLTQISNYFYRGRNCIIGIDIGTSSAKIVEVEYEQKQPVLRKAVLIALPENIREEGYTTGFSAFLQQVLERNGIQTQNAVVAVNGRSIFIREVVFPVMTQAELKEAIKWDMEKYVPFAPDSYYHDFAVIEQQSQEMKVLLVAAPHNLVIRMVNGIRAAGLRILAVDIEPLAIYRSLIGAENSLVVDLGCNVVKLIVFQNGSPAVTRIIAVNEGIFTTSSKQALELNFTVAKNCKQQEKLLENTSLKQPVLPVQLARFTSDLAREIRRTIEYLQLQNEVAAVDKVILSGGGARVDNLALQLAEEVDMQVVVYNSADRLTIPPALDFEQWQQAAPQFAVAVGLALWQGE